jgi:hypothetical protein
MATAPGAARSPSASFADGALRTGGSPRSVAQSAASSRDSNALAAVADSLGASRVQPTAVTPRAGAAADAAARQQLWAGPSLAGPSPVPRDGVLGLAPLRMTERGVATSGAEAEEEAARFEHALLGHSQSQVRLRWATPAGPRCILVRRATPNHAHVGRIHGEEADTL